MGSGTGILSDGDPEILGNSHPHRPKLIRLSRAIPSRYSRTVHPPRVPSHLRLAPRGMGARDVTPGRGSERIAVQANPVGVVCHGQRREYPLDLGCRNEKGRFAIWKNECILRYSFA